MTLEQQHHRVLGLIKHNQLIEAHPDIVNLIRQASANKTAPTCHYYHAEGYFLLGMVNAEIGQFNKATQCIEQANTILRRDEYDAYLAKCYALLGDTNLAMQAIDRIDMQQLQEPNALDTAGVSLSRIGFHDQALPYFEKAIGLNNTRYQYFYNYGMSLKFAGQFSAAKAAYDNALALYPQHAPSHFALADLGQATEQSNNIARLEELLAGATVQVDKSGRTVDDIMHYAHALALELQQVKRHEDAFKVLVDAKAQKAATLQYDIADDKELFAAVKAQLSTQAKPLVSSGKATPSRPIFIVGMPRSGTTLVERILSHHSQVGSGGELQDFGIAVKQLTQSAGQTVLDIDTIKQAQQLDFAQLGQLYLDKTQRIAPDDARFIDKLPFNFFYIQLIQQALPDAKIIIMLRDPMDTCIGNFRQLFSLNSPYYNYAFNLDTVGEFYAEFRQLMVAFVDHNPANIRVQQYETLAQSPDAQVRELLEFCELPFEPQCVQVQHNKLPVSTASKVQVRQPINTSSIGRWKKFGAATLPLQKRLSAHNLI
jgi:tetratricopeptide (TPR) repeat protein